MKFYEKKVKNIFSSAPLHNLFVAFTHAGKFPMYKATESNRIFCYMRNKGLAKLAFRRKLN